MEDVMSGKSKVRIPWSLLAMLVSTTACTGAPPVPVEVGRGAAVEFVNESLERAEVYVVVPAIDAHHLGVAMPGERRFFVVPEEVLRRGNGSISIHAVIPAHGARRNS